MRIYISAGKSTARIANSLSKALLGKDLLLFPARRPETMCGPSYATRTPLSIVLVGERDERSEWLGREWFEILEQASDRTKNLVGKAEAPNF